jgi:hypothetical protein
LRLFTVRDGGFTDAAEGATNASGRWRSPPLSAGTYVVQVLDGEENSFFWEEFVLTQPMERLEIEVPLVEVAGTLRFGDSPLAGDVVFGGRQGLGGRRIRVASDAEGKFSAILPHAGQWSVDVEADDPPIDALGLEVQVPRRRGRRPAKVEIEIPDTVVRGSVSNEQGRPVPGAEVRLVRLEPSPGVTTRTTDGAGAFELYGQLPGPCFLQARDLSSGDESGQVEAMLAEGMVAPPLHLVVQRKRVVRGRVTASTGPVAGAQVVGTSFPEVGQPTVPTSTQATANLDGVFELAVPKRTAEIQLVVLAPGHPLSASRARLSQEDIALSLVLDDPEGTLHVPRPGSRPGANGRRQGHLSIVLLNGEPLDEQILAMWAQEVTSSLPSGDLLTVPAMPPGSYRYCELEPQEALLVLWGAATPAESACSKGFLSPGGELTLPSPRSR